MSEKLAKRSCLLDDSIYFPYRRSLLLLFRINIRQLNVKLTFTDTAHSELFHSQSRNAFAFSVNKSCPSFQIPLESNCNNQLKL